MLAHLDRQAALPWPPLGRNWTAVGCHRSSLKSANRGFRSRLLAGFVARQVLRLGMPWYMAIISSPRPPPPCPITTDSHPPASSLDVFRLLYPAVECNAAVCQELLCRGEVCFGLGSHNDLVHRLQRPNVGLTRRSVRQGAKLAEKKILLPYHACILHRCTCVRSSSLNRQTAAIEA
jgi:hypothetical protein